MGFFIRKSINLGLFRINFTKSGIGISFGTTGARVSVNPKQTQLHLGRKGVYYKKSVKTADLLEKGTKMLRR